MSDPPPAPPPAPPPPGRTVEQRLAFYSAVVVTLGAVLGIIAWFPTFAGKQAELSAFALLKDNPTGVLVIRDLGAVRGAAGGAIGGAVKDGRHRYDVAYTLILKNTANGPFDVVWSLDQLFVGSPVAIAGDPAAVVVNDPPTIWDSASPGMLAWRQANYDLATDDLAAPDGDVENLAGRGMKVTAPGGGLTGQYIVGHIGAHSAHYRVTANPDDYVNVTITYGMDRPASLWQRATGGPAWVRFNEDLSGETVRLGDADQPGCPFGIAVANSQVKTACAASPL